MSRLFYFQSDPPGRTVLTRGIGVQTIRSFDSPKLKLLLPVPGIFGIQPVAALTATVMKVEDRCIIFSGISANGSPLDYNLVIRWSHHDAFYFNANRALSNTHPLDELLAANIPMDEVVITAQIVDPADINAVERSRELRFRILPNILGDPVPDPALYNLRVGDDIAPVFSVGDMPVPVRGLSVTIPTKRSFFNGAAAFKATNLQGESISPKFTLVNVSQPDSPPVPREQYVTPPDFSIHGLILSNVILGGGVTLGVNAPARWRTFPDLPSPAVSNNGTQEWEKMPEILHARRATKDTSILLSVTLSDNRFAFQDPISSLRGIPSLRNIIDTARRFLPQISPQTGWTIVPLKVDPVQLTCTFSPSPEDTIPGSGHSKMALEYNWIGDQTSGKLVASFDLIVDRPSSTPGETPLRIFDCDFVVAIESIDVAPGRIRLHNIHGTRMPASPMHGVPPPPSVRIPFDLELEIQNTSAAGTPLPAEFNLEALGFRNGIQPDIIAGSLRHLIMAVHSGSARLHLRFLLPQQNGNPASPDRDFVSVDIYDLPANPRPIDIEIPEPLVLHLDEWRDLAFTSSAPLNLQTSPRTDIIYSSGELLGIAEKWGRTPLAPELQQITVDIDTDFGSMPPIPVTNVTSAGRFTQPLSDLRLGTNSIQVTAWKPINIVMNGTPSVVTIELKGVLPVSPPILLPATLQDGDFVLRRALSGLRSGYARASAAHVMHMGRSGATLAISPALPLVYDSSITSVPTLVLPQELGRHQLWVRATNDFGQTDSALIELIAPRPEIEINPRTNNLPHDPRDLYNVGNSVVSCDGYISFIHALEVEFFEDGRSRFRRTIPDSDALSARRENMRFPSTGTFQERVGVLFHLDARNEFVRFDEDIEVTITRRANVFSFRDLELEIIAVDPNAHIIFDEISPYVIHESTSSSDPDQNLAGILLILDIVDTPSATGIDTIRFTVARDLDSNGRAIPARLDYRVEYRSGECIGPDYELFANFLSTTSESVDESRSESFPIELVDQTDLAEGHHYWRKVFVNSSSNSHALYFVTARYLL
jgi:hypothetical protein